jgi:hypothetical protein
MENRHQRMKVIYTVVERQSGKSFWTRVGVGYVNRDGSINLRLDAIPLNGHLQVREWEPFDRRPENDETSPTPNDPAPAMAAAPHASPRGTSNDTLM